MSATFYINKDNGFLHCHTSTREIIIPAVPYTGALALPIIAGEIRVAINGTSRELVWARYWNQPLRALRSTTVGHTSDYSNQPANSLFLAYSGTEPQIRFVATYPAGNMEVRLREASNFTPPGGSGALPGDGTSPEPPDPTKFLHYEASGNTVWTHWFNGTSSNQVDVLINACPIQHSPTLTNPFVHNGSTYYGGYSCVLD